MRVFIAKRRDGVEEITIVLPPSRRLAPVVLRATTRESLLAGFGEALATLRPEESSEPA